MATSNAEFSKLINSSTRKATGISSTDWNMCLKDNSTYVDCPIEDSFEGEFMLTSYNPSTVRQTIQRIKVPPANYAVQVFD